MTHARCFLRCQRCCPSFEDPVSPSWFYGRKSCAKAYNGRACSCNCLGVLGVSMYGRTTLPETCIAMSNVERSCECLDQPNKEAVKAFFVAAAVWIVVPQTCSLASCGRWEHHTVVLRCLYMVLRLQDSIQPAQSLRNPRFGVIEDI